MIEKETGGAYVHSLKIGHNIIDDTTDGFLMPVNEQVEMACAIIGNDTNLKARNLYLYIFSKHINDSIWILKPSLTQSN